MGAHGQSVRHLRPGGGDPRRADDGGGRAAAAARSDPRLRPRARPHGLDRGATGRPRPPRGVGGVRFGRERAQPHGRGGAVRMVDVGGKPLSRRRAVAFARVQMSLGDVAPAPRSAERRRAHDRAARRDHGGEADERIDPALPSTAALAHRGDARGAGGRRRDHGRRGDDGADRCRDGGADGGERRRAHGLRHVQGGRQGDVDRRGAAARED